MYDLIKKELLALKLETSTLSMSMKQAAPQASLQEAVRKHAETEAKLAFVMETLLALQTRLDSFSASKKEEHAMQVLQLQVRDNLRHSWLVCVTFTAEPYRYWLLVLRRLV